MNFSLRTALFFQKNLAIVCGHRQASFFLYFAKKRKKYNRISFFAELIIVLQKTCFQAKAKYHFQKQFFKMQNSKKFLTTFLGWTCIWYPLIIPFWSLSTGGSQETSTVLELMTEAFKLVGSPGTRKFDKKVR